MEATCSLCANGLGLLCPAAGFPDGIPLHWYLKDKPTAPIASHCDASHCASAPDALS
jgi:hypothetical protein